MKKITAFLGSLILSAAFLIIPAFAAVDLSAPAYVVDDANVLSDSLEKRIIETNESLYSDCQQAELVVVTVRYAPDGYDHEEFAKKIFDSWNPGNAKLNNGMVLVLYTEEDDFWLETGYGIYNSPYVDEIADLVNDDSIFYKNILKDKDEEAVQTLLNGLTGWYEDYYYSPSSGNGEYYSEPSTTRSSGNDFTALLIMVLFIIIVTSPFRIRRKYNRWGIWPLVWFSPWWAHRPRPYTYHSSTPGGSVYHSNNHYYGSSHSFGSYHSGSSHSSGWSSGGSSHSSGFSNHSSGFGGGHSSGGFHGGGGHSGGGFGHR